MKIILPSFAIGILLPATLLGQTGSLPAEQGRGAPPAATLGIPVASRTSGPLGLPAGATATLSNTGAVEGADLLVRRAADALAKHSTIAARVRFHVDLFGYRSVGQGLYLQQGLGAERKIRWELKTSIGEQIVTWQQVCDSRYLWLLTEMSPEERNLRRVDLRRVRLALEQASKPAEVSLNNRPELSIGGLPEMANNLCQSFHFTRAEAGQLDRLPVWIATGSWRPRSLKSIAPELADQAAKGQPLDLKKLPPQLPEEVLVYLGQEDLFPYRIEYRRRGAGQGSVGQGSAEQGRAGEGRGEAMATIMLAELFEVRLGEAIDVRQFDYEPSLSFADATEMFLKARGVKGER